jgi:hypothetical protein
VTTVGKAVHQRAVEGLRPWGIRAYRLWARGVFVYPPPRVLLTSLPKAGSHLLTSVLRRLPKMMFSGIHASLADFRSTTGRNGSRGSVEVDWSQVRAVLASVRDGQFVTAHFPMRSQLALLLEELDYTSILLLRDPRDVVVSHAFYVLKSPRHFLHERYTSALQNSDERLMASITGLPPDDSGRGLISIARRLDGYMGWLQDPRTHVTRFERLVGRDGGGDPVEQREEILAVARAVDREVSDGTAEKLGVEVWSPRSSTFRKGSIGDWINHFNAEHKAAFKDLAGRHLIDMGYEADYDW